MLNKIPHTTLFFVIFLPIFALSSCSLLSTGEIKNPEGSVPFSYRLWGPNELANLFGVTFPVKLGDKTEFNVYVLQLETTAPSVTLNVWSDIFMQMQQKAYFPVPPELLVAMVPRAANFGLTPGSVVGVSSPFSLRIAFNVKKGESFGKGTLYIRLNGIFYGMDL